MNANLYYWKDPIKSSFLEKVTTVCTMIALLGGLFFMGLALAKPAERQVQNPISFLEDFNASSVGPCQGSDIVSCRGVSVDFKVLRKDNQIYLPNWNETFQLDDSNEKGNFRGYFTRMFETDTNGSSTASFTMRKGKDVSVNGNVHLADGRIFDLENCGPDCHVWIEIQRPEASDNDTVDYIETPDSRSLEQIESERILLRKGIEDRNSIAWVSVAIYVTYDFYYQTPDFWGFLAAMFDKANDGLYRSGVNIRLWLHCAYLSNVRDVANGATMADQFLYSRYIRTTTNKLGSLLLLKCVLLFRDSDNLSRNLRGSADVAMLLNVNSNLGGYAYCSLPVGIVRKREATDFNVFLHELVHTTGGGHDRNTIAENGGGSCAATYYSYGKSFQWSPNQYGGFKTIMAYQRAHYFNPSNRLSGPYVYFNGSPTGDAWHNIVRHLNERRWIMAGKGDESRACGA